MEAHVGCIDRDVVVRDRAGRASERRARARRARLLLASQRRLRLQWRPIDVLRRDAKSVVLVSRLMALALEMAWVDLSCPKCTYALEVQLIDVRTGVCVWCPCCRARIRLVDDGTTAAGIDRVHREMKNLERMLKRMR